MPELPDVEVMKRDFQATALGQRIDEVRTVSEPLLYRTDPERLATTLRGDSFQEAGRHGKFLFCGLRSGWWLVLHFGMTGYLAFFRNPEEDPVHDRLRLTFDSGLHVAYVCQRKLGRVDLCRDRHEYARKLRLGPDPLDEAFDFRRFRGLLSGRRGRIKSALMNQKILAGIGNVYADEILFQAGVHPEARVDRLSGKALHAIHAAMGRVLRTAVESSADPGGMPETFLLPHRDGDGRCPVCGGALEKISLSGRTACFCPVCQG